jgi:hypothetical protein
MFVKVGEMMEENADPSVPKKRKGWGCLGCLGFTVLFVLLMGTGFWGYGAYTTAQREKAEAERFFKIGLAMDEGALVDTKMGTNYLDKEFSEADPKGDPDADGLTNKEEVDAGTNPMDDDSDNDGLTDGDEVKKYGSDPNRRSSANDGVSDLVKVLEKVDPKGPLPSSSTVHRFAYKDLGVSLSTTDLQSKHLHMVKPFRSVTIDSLGSLRTPVIIRDYKGEVALSYPPHLDAAKVKAYYYDLKQQKLVEIEGQITDPANGVIRFQSNAEFPILLKDPRSVKEMPTSYYIVRSEGVAELGMESFTLVFGRYFRSCTHKTDTPGNQGAAWHKPLCTGGVRLGDDRLWRSAQREGAQTLLLPGSSAVEIAQRRGPG